MKRIAKSIVIIVAVAALLTGATIALFSDRETSEGNEFKAGKLNLKLDNECHYNGKVCADGVWEGTDESCDCTWEEAKDLDGEIFFDFDDIKPGDFGEDTVSIHVDNNDAWVCAELANLTSFDNGCDSPENLEDGTCGNPGAGEGELQDNLFFTVWEDTDCDNELDETFQDEAGVCTGGMPQCGASTNPQSCQNNQFGCTWVYDNPAIPGENVLVDNQPVSEGIWPIADSTTGNGPIIGDEKTCLGISWNVPLKTSNVIQTDSLTGDLKFTAVQARHMEDYQCSQLIAWYEFSDDVASGTALDSSGNGHDATIVGGITSTAGKVGQAFNFDGSTGYLTVPYSEELDPVNYEELSYEFWLKQEYSNDRKYCVIYQPGSQELFMQTRQSSAPYWQYFSADFRRDTGSGWRVNQANVPLSEWHHIVAMYDKNDHGIIYVDGTKVTDNSFSSSTHFKGGVVGGMSAFIGHDPAHTNNKFYGDIDEMKIYGRILSPGEIQAHYQAGL